jgi:hypothetical protein
MDRFPFFFLNLNIHRAQLRRAFFPTGYSAHKDNCQPQDNQNQADPE